MPFLCKAGLDRKAVESGCTKPSGDRYISSVAAPARSARTFIERRSGSSLLMVRTRSDSSDRILNLPRRREMLAPRQFGDARNVWESNDAAVGETDALVAYLSERRIERFSGPNAARDKKDQARAGYARRQAR
jgi:hypothetical protein